MDVLLVAVIAALSAIATGYLSYRVAKRSDTTTQRNTSGSVATSDAAALWSEGAALRDSLSAQVTGLRKELAEATGSIKDLLHEIALSNTAAAAAQAATEDARDETRAAREETRQLREDIADVRHEVKTGNALTLGALADNAESRRIALIPHGQRTAGENEHLDNLGIQTENADD